MIFLQSRLSGHLLLCEWAVSEKQRGFLIINRSVVSGLIRNDIRQIRPLVNQ